MKEPLKAEHLRHFWQNQYSIAAMFAPQNEDKYCFKIQHIFMFCLAQTTWKRRLCYSHLYKPISVKVLPCYFMISPVLSRPGSLYSFLFFSFPPSATAAMGSLIWCQMVKSRVWIIDWNHSVRTEFLGDGGWVEAALHSNCPPPTSSFLSWQPSAECYPALMNSTKTL